jgi:hypothetical protein
MNSLQSWLTPSGMAGGSSVEAMWNMHEACEVNCDHGGLPEAISITVQPTLQMSA